MSANAKKSHAPGQIAYDAILFIIAANNPVGIIRSRDPIVCRTVTRPNAHAFQKIKPVEEKLKLADDRIVIKTIALVLQRVAGHFVKVLPKPKL